MKKYLSVFIMVTVLSVLNYSERAFALAGDAREATQEDALAAVVNINGATGVLIGPKVVLTAGHVISFGDANKDETKITFRESSQPEKVFKIKKWKAAERGMFETRYLDHSGQDLAVIVLEEDASKILNIKPMSLFDKSGATLVGKKIQLAGYGVGTLDAQGRCYGESSEKLRVATSDVVELLKDEGRWGAPLIIGRAGLTPCNGDSGGPAFLKVDGSLFVVGITSGPYNPTPGVDLGRSFQYADVASARDWLNKAFVELDVGVASVPSKSDASPH